MENAIRGGLAERALAACGSSPVLATPPVPDSAGRAAEPRRRRAAARSAPARRSRVGKPGNPERAREGGLEVARLHVERPRGELGDRPRRQLARERRDSTPGGDLGRLAHREEAPGGERPG